MMANDAAALQVRRKPSPRRCRRCWSKPNGWPRSVVQGSMAVVAPVRARASGSSAATSRAIRPATSTGANRPNPIPSMSAKPNGRQRRRCGCGSTARPRCVGARVPNCRKSTARRFARPGPVGPADKRRRAGRPPRRIRTADRGQAMLSRLANALVDQDGEGLPDRPLPRLAHTVLLSDFLMPLEDVQGAVAAGRGRGARSSGPSA